MATFILLLRGGDFTKYSPAEMKTVVQDYYSWSEKLRGQGKNKGGDELKPGGRLISIKNGKPTDGPFTETKEVIGGYFMIEEPSLAAAAETSKECPHLKYGGTIELRETDPHRD
jgi:hypothetical protein